MIEELPLLMSEFKDFLATYKNDFAKIVHIDEMSEYNTMIEELEQKVEKCIKC